jgi:hypothetical protein
MKKTLLTLSIALASLFATQAFAQKDVAGEARAVPAAKTTPAEKADAKVARKTIGTAAVKSSTAGDDKPATTATAKRTKGETLAARAKRKSAGAEATKAAKDKSGPN